MEFKLHAPFKPTGDQPEAIEKLAQGVKMGLDEQVLLGVTGSGKTFTMASVIEKVQRPTLVLAHNKTLAAQLCAEFKEFFPENAVEYFVSYYDYYQPEAYIPHTDTYIAKDASTNEEIDRLRLSATCALLERRDVIVVSSVSCIYGLGEPEEFGDMPLSYANGNGVVYGDLYVRASYDAVVGRDVTLDKLPAQRMRVANGDYVDSINKAYYAFTDKHPEYMISISTTLDTDSLLQSMMNRDSSVDIYTLPSTSSAFTSLMNRGFMAELEGNQTISDAVNAMYGFLKDYVMKDGHIYALPLSCYANMMSLNTKLLTEKLGYEVPTSWKGLLTILADISNNKRLEETPEVMIAEPGYDKTDFRSQVFYMMLADYFTWLDASEENLTRGTQALLDLCEAFEAIDWDNLGLAEDYEDSEDMGYNMGDILIEWTSLSVYNYVGADEEQATPVALSVVEGEKPLIGQSVTFAFINPFSEHRDEAAEYLADAWALERKEDVIMLSPEMNEPVLNSYYEENLRNIDSSIADVQKTLDKTEDEETRESLQANLDSMKQWREDFEKSGKYEISPEQIANYRAFGENMAVQQSLIWNTNEGSTQVQQYLDGAMNAQQLAAALEKTLQMQKLEGN